MANSLLQQQRQSLEEARRRVMSQQNLRQAQDRNVALKRQQQLQQLSEAEQQINAQDLQLQQLEQQQSQEPQNNQAQRQLALKTLVEKGKGSSALYSLSPQERAEVEAIASEIKASRERSAGLYAVSKAEQALSSSLIPELRSQIYKEGASGASTINLPNLNAKFEQFTTPQYTPAPQKTYGPIQQFYTQAPLSVTNPKEYYKQQVIRLLQKPEKSFQTLSSYAGQKAQQYAQASRNSNQPKFRIGPTGFPEEIPYSPAPSSYKKTPEQIGQEVKSIANIGSYFVPVLGEARLVGYAADVAGRAITGEKKALMEAGLLSAGGLFFAAGKGIASEVGGEVVSTKFISQRQSGKSTDINQFTKELSDITEAPVTLRSQSRIQSGVVQLKNQKGATERFTYKLAEESLGGGLTEFSGNRLIKGFIKDSKGNVVSNINSLSSESTKDLVSNILTTSIVDIGKTREVQTIAEQIVSRPSPAPKNVAFILKKPKGIDIVQTPKKTLIDIGEKKLNVKYFEDIGIAVARPSKEIVIKSLRKENPEKLLRQLELKFDEGVFTSIFKNKKLERAIAKTQRTTIQQPINILQGFEGGLRKTSMELESGITNTELIPSKVMPKKKGVTMNQYLKEFNRNIKKAEAETARNNPMQLVSLRLDQLKSLKMGSEGTTALLVKSALPKTIKTSPTQAERAISRATSGAMFEGINLFPEQTQTRYFKDVEVLARPPRSPDLTFQDLGLVQKPIVKPLQIQLQKEKLKLFEEVKSKQQTLTKNMPKILEKIIPLLRTNQLQRQEQQLTQLQRQRQIQRQLTSISPRPRVRPPRIKIPFPILVNGVGTARVGTEDLSNVGIEVRRGGRFTSIGQESSLGKALMKASSFVDVNLARSFRLRQLSTGQLLDVPVPVGFRRAKREGKTFVELSSRALSQFGEKKEIQYFKKSKRRRLL